MNYTKNKIGEKINNFTLIEQVKGQKWLVKCDCGSELIRRISAIKGQNNCNLCKPKLKNENHPSWKGHGELSHDLYTTFKHSALAKNLEFNVSIEYLWELFLIQNRNCVFTGEELFFNTTYRGKKNKTASLDRIDSSKGYIEGNLQWVHRDVNKLKKNFTDERFLEICLKVSNFYKKN